MKSIRKTVCFSVLAIMGLLGSDLSAALSSASRVAPALRQWASRFTSTAPELSAMEQMAVRQKSQQAALDTLSSQEAGQAKHVPTDLATRESGYNSLEAGQADYLRSVKLKTLAKKKAQDRAFEAMENPIPTEAQNAAAHKGFKRFDIGAGLLGTGYYLGRPVYQQNFAQEQMSQSASPVAGSMLTPAEQELLESERVTMREKARLWDEQQAALLAQQEEQRQQYLQGIAAARYLSYKPSVAVRPFVEQARIALGIPKQKTIDDAIKIKAQERVKAQREYTDSLQKYNKDLAAYNQSWFGSKPQMPTKPDILKTSEDYAQEARQFQAAQDQYKADIQAYNERWGITKKVRGKPSRPDIDFPTGPQPVGLFQDKALEEYNQALVEYQQEKQKYDNRYWITKKLLASEPPKPQLQRHPLPRQQYPVRPYDLGIITSTLPKNISGSQLAVPTGRIGSLYNPENWQQRQYLKNIDQTLKKEKKVK